MRSKKYKILQNKIITSLFILIIFILNGCDSKRHLHDLETFVVQTKQSNVNRSKKNLLEGMKEPKSVVYTANTARSPFELNAINVPVNASHSKDPLQSYPVQILRFKGISFENGRTTAFILTPDDKVYQAKVGDTLGDHAGKIIHIYPDRLEVKERVETPNAQGIPQISQRIVTLQRKETSDG